MVDDIIMKQAGRRSREDQWRWRAFNHASHESVIVGTGIEPEHLYLESQFVAPARELVDAITNMQLPASYRLSQDGRKLHVGSGKERFSVPLLGYKGVDDPTHPSCQLLDLAWLTHRLTIAPQAVTVLPNSYAQQQRGVALLAGLTGIDPASYQSVFYDPSVVEPRTS